MYTGDADTLVKLVNMPESLKNKENPEAALRGKLELMVGLIKLKAEEKGGLASITAGKTSYSEDKKTAKVPVTVKFKNGEKTIKPTRVFLDNNRWMIGKK